MCSCGNYTGCGCKSNMTGEKFGNAMWPKKVHPSKSHRKANSDEVSNLPSEDVFGNLDGESEYGNLDGNEGMYGFDNADGKGMEKLNTLGSKAKSIFDKGKDFLGGLKNGTGVIDNTPPPLPPTPEDNTMKYLGIGVVLVLIIGIIIYVKNKA